MVIDFRKLNKATKKDHYPLPFIDQMLERLCKHTHYCFLDGYSGFSQLPVSPDDQSKTTFTCPFGTFAYRHLPFEILGDPPPPKGDPVFELKRCLIILNMLILMKRRYILLLLVLTFQGMKKKDY